MLKLKVHYNLGIRNGSKTYNKILARMGNQNYKEWQNVLSNPKYIL